MLYIILSIFLLNAKPSSDVDFAFNYMLSSLIPSSSKRIKVDAEDIKNNYTDGISSTNSFIKLTASTYNTKLFIEKSNSLISQINDPKLSDLKNKLSARNELLNTSLDLANEIAKDFSKDKDNSSRINKLNIYEKQLKALSLTNKEARLLNRFLRKNDINFLDFNITDGSAAAEHMEALLLGCKAIKNSDNEAQKKDQELCVTNRLINDLEGVSRKENLKDILEACCSTKELDDLKKKQLSFIATSGIATLLELGYGATNPFATTAGAINQSIGRNFTKDPEFTNQTFLKSQTVMASFLNGGMPLNSPTYTPYSVDPYQMMASNTYSPTSNPITNTTNTYSNYTDQARDYNAGIEATLNGANFNNTTFQKKINDYQVSIADAKLGKTGEDYIKISRDGAGDSDIIGGDPTSTPTNEDGTTALDLNNLDDQTDTFYANQYRLRVSEIGEERKNLLSESYTENSNIIRKGFECALGGAFTKVKCYSDLATAQGEMEQKRQTIYNLDYELYNISQLIRLGGLGFNFIDVFKKSLDFNTMYASNSKTGKSKLSITDIAKPYKTKIYLDKDWREKLYKLGVSLKEKAKLAKKNAKKIKKDLRKLLKIKQKDVSVAELANTNDILKLMKNVNMLKTQTLKNQKYLENAIKYNKKIKQNKTYLSEARVLQKSFASLDSTLEEEPFRKSFFLTKNLFNEIPRNTALRSVATDIIEGD